MRDYRTYAIRLAVEGNVAANVELQLPMGGVFALFGGAPLGAVTYSVGDSGRHYGK